MLIDTEKGPDNLRHHHNLNTVASFRIWRGFPAVMCKASGPCSGKRGIRTPDRLSPMHAFQACTLNHSDIFPKKTTGFFLVVSYRRKTETAASKDRTKTFVLEKAERGGFEPPIPKKWYNGFRDRPDRPLSHLSKNQ